MEFTKVPYHTFSHHPGHYSGHRLEIRDQNCIMDEVHQDMANCHEFWHALSHESNISQVAWSCATILVLTIWGSAPNFENNLQELDILELRELLGINDKPRLSCCNSGHCPKFVPEPIPAPPHAPFTVNFGTLTAPIARHSYTWLVGSQVTPLSQEFFVLYWRYKHNMLIRLHHNDFIELAIATCG